MSANAYYIESLDGFPMGVYEGDTAEAAVAALNEDAGGESNTDDWTIIAVTQTDQDWDAEETIHTLENGVRVVCSGPHIRYQRPA